MHKNYCVISPKEKTDFPFALINFCASKFGIKTVFNSFKSQVFGFLNHSAMFILTSIVALLVKSIVPSQF